MATENINQLRSPYYERLSGDVKERYDEKMKKCGGIDPYSIQRKNLSVNSKDFPQITIYDITNYMIHSVSSYTKRFFENYKGTEAYKFFESGFVVYIGSKNINNLSIVTAKVLHSQRLNDSASNAWILAESTGKVICAHCTCVAGLSETCSHVGAICFAIHKISESKEAKSVTDILCKWNVPKFKDVSMSAAKDIDWRFSNRQRAAYETKFLEYCDSINHLTDQTIEKFLNECHSDGNDAALRSIMFPLERKRLTNLKDEIFLSSLYNEKNRNKSLEELVKIGRAMSINISENEAREIFKITLPRLKSKCYVGLRRGRITGSTFKSCCVTNVEDPSMITIKRVISPMKNLGLIPSIRYQLQNKSKAIKEYTKWAISHHEDFVYAECGLIVNADLPYFVGSPDGLIFCSCHGDGCLEVKCLNIPEIDTLDDFLTRKPNNMLNKFGEHYEVERSHELFYQVQFQINLNRSRFCDCIMWTPQKIIVVRLYADINFWSVEMSRALKFHEVVIMPELLGKYYTQDNDDRHYEEGYEENFENNAHELLTLEIEHLESDEYHDTVLASTSSDTIELFDSSENQFNRERSIDHTSLEMSLAESKMKYHSQSDDEDIENNGHELLKLEIEILESDGWHNTASAPTSTSSDTNLAVSASRLINLEQSIGSTLFGLSLAEPQINGRGCNSIQSSNHREINDLKLVSIEELCSSFDNHEEYLTDVYGKLIKEKKRHYRPSDLPSFAAFDLVTEKQFEAMVRVAESKLLSNIEEPNSSDVIFDAIIAEWSYKIICEKYSLNRKQAIQAIEQMNLLKYN